MVLIELTFVKLKTISKHSLPKPNFSESIQKDLVIIISDTTSILYLSNHVTDCRPGHALDKTSSLKTDSYTTTKYTVNYYRPSLDRCHLNGFVRIEQSL